MVKALSILLLLYCAIPASAVNYFIYCHCLFGSLKFTEQCALSIKIYFMSLLCKSQTRLQSTFDKLVWSFIVLLQQSTCSLTQELTEAHAYELEHCLAEGEGAHPSFASHCRCSLHHPRKQENLSSLASAGSAAKGFWGKLVYSCLPAWSPGLYLSCGLLQLIPKTSKLIRHCQAATCAAVPALLTAGLGLGGAVPRGALSRSQARAAVDPDPVSAAALSSPDLSQSGTKYSSNLELLQTQL